MQLFYLPGISGVGDIASMDEEEARHCLKVLRKKAGDVVEVVDGKGHLYEAEITDDNLKSCTVKALKELENTQQRSFELTIAIAPPKNTERLEWFMEKVTEIGIDRVIPMFTEHSERRRLNIERLQKIVVSAMKQSGKALLPLVEEAVIFGKFVEAEGKTDKYEKYIATCFGEDRPHLKDVYKKGSNALVLIGPEGDFSESEMTLAIKNGFRPISLGRSRLRLETAGIVACHIINLANE